jgi:O-antigen/teichoic acid export membrane protein
MPMRAMRSDGNIARLIPKLKEELEKPSLFAYHTADPTAHHLPLQEQTSAQTISARSVARNSLLLFGFHIFIKLLSLGSSILLANTLGSHLFGIYSYAFALTSIFLPLADIGMDMYLLRELPRRKEEFLASTLPPILIGKVVLALAVLILMTITAGFLESFGSDKFTLIVLAGTITLLRAFGTTFGYLLRSYNAVSYEVSLQGLVRFAEFAAIVLWVLETTDLPRLMLFLTTINVAGVLGTYLLIRRRYRVRMRGGTTLKPILRGSLPFALTTVFTAVYFNFDTVLVAKCIGDTAAGIYRAAYNIIMPLMMVTAAISGAVFPYVSQRFRSHTEEVAEVVQRSAVYVLMVGLPIACITAVTAERIVVFIFKPEFAPAATSLAILIWFIPIVYLTNLFGHVLGAADDQPYVLRVSGINLLFNIVANLLLIPLFAQVGAATTTVLTELIGLVLLSVRVRQRFGSIISRQQFFKILAASVLPSLLLVPPLEIPLLVLLAAMLFLYSVFLFAFKAVSPAELRSLFALVGGIREAH